MNKTFAIILACLALIAVLSAGAVCLADHRITLGRVVAAANRIPVGKLDHSGWDSLLKKMSTKTDSSIPQNEKRSEGFRRFHTADRLLSAVLATLSCSMMPNGSE